MRPQDILSETNQIPPKEGLEPFRQSIDELRKKGLSWRAIASFLKERGVETDHTQIYRFMARNGRYYPQDSPLSDADGFVLLGGVLHEARAGKLIRDYQRGINVRIIQKSEFYLLEDDEHGVSQWCECHFDLNCRPCEDWFEQLKIELRAFSHSYSPFYFHSKEGFEVKIEGKCLALICPCSELKIAYQKLASGIMAATKKTLEKAAHIRKAEDLRRKKMSALSKIYVFDHGKEEDALDEHNDYYREREKQFRKDFDSLDLT